MAQVRFEDNRMEVMAALDDAAITYLYKACGELETQVKRNTRVDTGQLKNSWAYRVDESKGEGVIGSPLENAIWEEFGTGEYALEGNGRKGGWYYRDKKTGKLRFTYGKTPNRALYNAFIGLKSTLIQRAEQVLKARMK